MVAFDSKLHKQLKKIAFQNDISVSKIIRLSVKKVFGLDCAYEKDADDDIDNYKKPANL